MTKSTVLIVEDEAIVAADLAGKLEQLGYEVVGQAAGGEEAIELACRLQPQLILMDIRLKGQMDGIEAAEAIRRRFDVPLIYLTAHSDSATLERAKLSDPFGYILKPFDERDLSTAIKMALHKHQSDRQLREQRKLLEESEVRLQAANEKLQLVNEELQTANEELQSQGEELQTQNQELMLLWEESRRTKDVLTESRERLQLALGSAGMASFDWDIVNNRRTWDDNVHNLLGTDPANFTGTAEEFFRVIHPEDRRIVQSDLSKAIETNGKYETEYRAVWPDGTIRHIAASGKVHRDNTGRADRMSGVCWDITEQKQAEETLKRLNETLEIQVADRTRELVTTINNLQLEISEREKAEENVLRLNRFHKVLSQTNQAIVRTKDQETLFCDFCRIAVEDGSFKLAWVGLVDEESGKLNIVASNGATGYLEDISITANTEPVGLGPTGITVREGTYYICNDFLGSSITRPWHERGRAHGIRASASIALKQEGWVVGALTLYADKEDFFDRQQVELLRQMGADVSFALDVIVLESRRRKAEQALKNETVERLRAVEELREKDQMLIHQSRLAAMGEMIGNIAHQWRQPLNSLGLIVQQTPLFFKLGEVDQEFLNNNAMKSMELIKHMSRTIDDFRNFFKPDKEKVQFRVHEEVVKTLSLLEGSLSNQRIRIEVEPKDDPVVHGYPNEFSQVILNILTNARDALAEREIDNPLVRITIDMEGNRSVVTIADNAGGIPEDIIDRIFEPYFTTKGSQAGTGIGLFILHSRTL